MIEPDSMRNAAHRSPLAELEPMRSAAGCDPWQGRGAGGNTADVVSRIMANDKNGDGKIDKDELPERMQRILERADANKDGALEKGEIEKMLQNIGRGGGDRQGGGQRPARPANGERPQRPGSN